MTGKYRNGRKIGNRLYLQLGGVMMDIQTVIQLEREKLQYRERGEGPCAGR